MDNAHTISVVICVYAMDRWKDICEAVQSVRNQTLRPHEIIMVVDHNAELLERARAAFPDVLVVANTEARGLSGGRNTGIAVSSGALVAYLDDTRSRIRAGFRFWPRIANTVMSSARPPK